MMEGTRSFLRLGSAGAVLLLVFLAGCADPEERYARGLEQAREELASGNREAAVEELNDLYEEFPERTELLVEIGEILEEEGDGVFAAAYYERAAREGTGGGDLFLRAAQLYEAAGDAGQAREVLDLYFEAEEGDAGAYLLSADLYQRERRWQSALREYLRADRLDGPGRNPAYAVQIADLYRSLGNLAQAEVYYQRALEASPEDRLTALLGLLSTQYERGEYNAAEETIAQLEEQFPGALASSEQAAVAEEVAAWRESLEEAAAILAATEEPVDPEPAGEEVASGEESVPAGDDPTVADEVGEEVTAAREDTPARAGEGAGAEGAAGETAEEAATPVRAGKLAAAGAAGGAAGTGGEADAPDLPVAAPEEESGEPVAAGRGAAGGEGEEPAVSVEAAREEPAPVVPEPPAWERLRNEAETVLAAGDPEGAVRLYWQAVNRRMEDPDLWAGLAGAYAEAGDLPNAEIALLEARRREPENLNYLLRYLRIVQETRSRLGFRDELERAYEQFPNSPDVLLSLARFYAGPGNNSGGGRFYYQEFLRLAPDHPEADQARVELGRLP